MASSSLARRASLIETATPLAAWWPRREAGSRRRSSPPCSPEQESPLVCSGSSCRAQAGYIGSHVVLKLVQAGYDVRACVRNAQDHEKVAHLRAMNTIEDCDGTLTADDCDDTSADSTTVAIDGDCDGTEFGDDCDDADPTLLAIADDSDCDGVLD